MEQLRRKPLGGTRKVLGEEVDPEKPGREPLSKKQRRPNWEKVFTGVRDIWRSLLDVLFLNELKEINEVKEKDKQCVINSDHVGASDCPQFN